MTPVIVAAVAFALGGTPSEPAPTVEAELSVSQERSVPHPMASGPASAPPTPAETASPSARAQLSEEQTERLREILVSAAPPVDDGSRVAIGLLGVGLGTVALVPSLREAMWMDSTHQPQAAAVAGLSGVLIVLSGVVALLPPSESLSALFERRLKEPGADPQRVLREFDVLLERFAQTLRVGRIAGQISGWVLAVLCAGLTVLHEVSPAWEPEVRFGLRMTLPALTMLGATSAVVSATTRTPYERQVELWHRERGTRPQVGVAPVAGGAILGINARF